MDGYGPSSYGDAFAEVYDDWYATITPVNATVAFIASRSPGLVVELGSGTGRIAGAAVGAGLATIGVDVSLPMLTRSRVRHPALPVAAADMTAVPLADGAADVVLLTFNTLFNIGTSDGQRQALGEAARLAGRAGVVVIEAFVPAEDADAGTDEPADHIEIGRIEARAVTLRVSRTSSDGHGGGIVSGAHVELRDGETVRVRPWQLRYRSPAGVDALAAEAGLELLTRFAGWAGEVFDDESANHVSVYGPAGGRG